MWGIPIRVRVVIVRSPTAVGRRFSPAVTESVLLPRPPYVAPLRVSAPSFRWQTKLRHRDGMVLKSCARCHVTNPGLSGLPLRYRLGCIRVWTIFVHRAWQLSD